MSSKYQLRFRCNILPEYIERFRENLDSKKEKWNAYDIWNGDIWFNFDNTILECIIKNPVKGHLCSLNDNYVSFMKKCVVPYTSYIHYCNIGSENETNIQYYSDSDLRNSDIDVYEGNFDLHDSIRSILHVYNDDGDIIKTIVTYKEPVKRKQELSLDKSYGVY